MNRLQRIKAQANQAKGNTARTNTQESKPMPSIGASASPDDQSGATHYTTKDGQRRAKPGANLILMWDIFLTFRDQPISVTDATQLLADYGFDAMRVSGIMQSFSWPNAYKFKPGQHQAGKASTVAGIMGKAPGLVYRVSRGTYVYDTGARIFRGKLVDNSFSCWAGKGNVIPASPPMPERKTLDPSVAYGPDDVSRQMAELRAEREAEAPTLPTTLAARLAQLQSMQPESFRVVEPAVSAVSAWHIPEDEPEAEAERTRDTFAAKGTPPPPAPAQPTYTVEFLLHETTPDGDENTLSLEDLDLGAQPSLVAAISAWIFVRDSR
jgi:hypothetical protein